MKVILKEDMPNLGFKDEVVEVKPGYGRNFLIPQGKAIIANESALKQLAEDQRQQAHKLAAILEKAEKQAEKLHDVKVELEVKTSNTGRIYGSVTPTMVADALEAQGHDINRKMLLIPGGIKETGEYVARVRFHKDVTVEIPLIVVSENAAEIAAEKAKAKAEEEAHQAERARQLAEAEAAEAADEEVAESTEENEESTEA